MNKLLLQRDSHYKILLVVAVAVLVVQVLV